MTDPSPSLIEKLAANRRLAHQTFFKHRHHDETPPFHYELIDFLHAPHQFGVVLAFRGAAKSTIAEEDIALDAVARQFHNCVIVGAMEERAVERLDAIAFELENNEFIEAVAGRQKTPRSKWRQTKIVLKNGVVIQALGRDQAVRGLKHRDWRPDLLLLDDIEDKQNVQTTEGRRKTMQWLLGELLPVCDPRARVRVLATPMAADSVPVRLIRDAKWPSFVVPIKRLDKKGQWEATWPERYPLHKIDETERLYTTLGQLHIFNQEFMCDTTPGEQGTVFPKLKVEPRPRSWEPVYCMIDPARTAKSSSASTGVAAWSWIGPRLHVWKAKAGIWLPDQIIDEIFSLAIEFSPVQIGVEEDGLNEFILQPLRHEMARRHLMIPIKPMKAPRGKLDFIRGLQPYAANGEITLNEISPDLDEQLANFPAGRIDVPNALAYALPMRPGLPVFENFTNDNIDPDLAPVGSRPVYLAANAQKALVAAALVQFVEGQIRVYADWVVEGSPLDVVSEVHCEAAMEGDTARLVEVNRNDAWYDLLKNPAKRLELARQPVRWVIPRHHADEWNNVGLTQAISRVPGKYTFGGALEGGKAELQRRLKVSARLGPELMVSPRATWTVRALGGGYNRPVAKGGGLMPDPEPGPYRVLIEGLESWAAILAQAEEANDRTGNIAYTRAGQPYLSVNPAR